MNERVAADAAAACDVDLAFGRLPDTRSRTSPGLSDAGRGALGEARRSDEPRITGETRSASSGPSSRTCGGGAKRIVTVGAAGSHHVLATTSSGAGGLEVEAVLVPQPRTARRRRAAGGARPGCTRSPCVVGAVPFAVARRVRPGTRFVPVGGSSVVGAMGYVKAARELATQVREGALPEPDVCVVALGSGGTAAGLAAGFAAEGLRRRFVGVCVASPPWLVLASLRRPRRRLRAAASEGGTRGVGAG